MRRSIANKIKFLTASAVIVLSGCVDLPPPAGMSQAQAAPAAQEPARYMRVSGCWAFVDSKGHRQVNYVERIDEDLLLVNRAGAPTKFQYQRVDWGIYQAIDSPATYRFANNVAVWSSNDKRRITFRLSYIGYNC